jgi:putative PIN family toxin of toxin-antitoxin system
MKIVLDTNILISGILWKGSPNEILKHIETDKRLELVQSAETFNELEEVIKRDKFAEIIEKRHININLILSAIITVCKFYNVSDQTREKIKKEVVIEDIDDLKFIDLAVEAEADYIISGDNHLLKLERYKSLKIIDTTEFLKIIKSSRL